MLVCCWFCDVLGLELLFTELGIKENVQMTIMWDAYMDVDSWPAVCAGDCEAV